MSVDMMKVILFLTASTNLLIAVINLTTAIIARQKKKKRPFPNSPRRPIRKRQRNK